MAEMSEARMSDVEAAIKHALNYFDSEISQIKYQRAICEIDKRTVYVANLTANLEKLEGYRATIAALAALRRPSHIDREKIAEALAGDLVKRPGEHGAKIYSAASLDNVILDGHVNLRSLADAAIRALEQETGKP